MPKTSEMLMEIIYILLPLSFLVGFGFLVACIVAIKKGQFEDSEAPAVRILRDED